MADISLAPATCVNHIQHVVEHVPIQATADFNAANHKTTGHHIHANKPPSTMQLLILTNPFQLLAECDNDSITTHNINSHHPSSIQTQTSPYSNSAQRPTKAANTKPSLAKLQAKKSFASEDTTLQACKLPSNSSTIEPSTKSLIHTLKQPCQHSAPSLPAIDDTPRVMHPQCVAQSPTISTPRDEVVIDSAPISPYQHLSPPDSMVLPPPTQLKSSISKELRGKDPQEFNDLNGGLEFKPEYNCTNQ